VQPRTEGLVQPLISLGRTSLLGGGIHSVIASSIARSWEEPVKKEGKDRKEEGAGNKKRSQRKVFLGHRDYKQALADKDH